jgi:hypothetical protein
MFIKIQPNGTTTTYDINRLYTDYPNTSFPPDIIINYNALKELNIYPLHSKSKPDFDYRTEKVVEGEPLYVDNSWHQTWNKQSLTSQEVQDIVTIKLQEVRALRNRLLTESDWTQLKDVNPAITQQWSEYRQLLRNITSQPDAPFDIIWPNQP